MLVNSNWDLKGFERASRTLNHARETQSGVRYAEEDFSFCGNCQLQKAMMPITNCGCLLCNDCISTVRNEWTNLLSEDFKEKTKKNFISQGVEVVWNHKHIIGAFFFALYVISKSINNIHTIANSIDELKTTFVDLKSGLKSWIEDHARTVGAL
ncbi:PREDICTED: uncharacterized protein LOC104791399 isoform X2 [Camelina sativa]|uniref:Uncharacterized protein LOC104791399 isoform X2 n=1 Tax=Camelina sativa TaxID=90675 RepID=A0ABM0ZGX6_CAMSA|nr:PREDICTED: uncharacterized protein LOC104791399 isoform X2 [Camelina sativa]